MKGKKTVRFLLGDSDISQFVYRPPKNGTKGTRFAQKRAILNDHWLIGGTQWVHFKYWLKHPIVYSRWSFRKLYRRIKRLFIKDDNREKML